MAFVDSITVKMAAGTGGGGAVHWLRERGRPRGGPCGGDGGRGGDVILEGARDLGALAAYRFTKEFTAEDGGIGGYNNRHGADGDHIVLRVPVGTFATIHKTGKTHEVMQEGQRVTLLTGGIGGLGNDHFKSSTNQNPTKHTPGRQGGESEVTIELKIIAKAGFIGLPSAGKSSLLNALTRARAKVGAYPFTTLEPNLGDFYGSILADIPGLIEGASEGKGLGSRFLKHVERTGFLVHLVSAEQDDVVVSYKQIRKELQSFGNHLSDKKEIVVLSKVDLVEENQIEKMVGALKKASSTEVLTVSIEDIDLLKKFSDRLSAILAAV